MMSVQQGIQCQFNIVGSTSVQQGTQSYFGKQYWFNREYNAGSTGNTMSVQQRTGCQVTWQTMSVQQGNMMSVQQGI